MSLHSPTNLTKSLCFAYFMAGRVFALISLSKKQCTASERYGRLGPYRKSPFGACLTSFGVFVLEYEARGRTST